MTPAQWTALAERCEAATGPSRELDAAIYEALGYEVKRRPIYEKWGAKRPRAWAFLCDGRWRAMDYLTRSTDAILALIASRFGGFVLESEGGSSRAGIGPTGRFPSPGHTPALDLRVTRFARMKGRAVVPMTNALRAALTQAHQIALTGHVIEHGGKRIQRIAKGVKSAAVRSGLPWVSPHVLRHSAAVWMAEDGVPMPEIAAFLGHSDSRITEQVYARFSPNHLRRAASSLETGSHAPARTTRGKVS